MSLDAVKNFARVEVSTGYDDTATSIALSSGEGAKLPDPSTDGEFNLIWFNYSDYPNPVNDPNVEIVRCTARSTDTLTVTRAQESTSASTKNEAGKTYEMMLGITGKMIEDIDTNKLDNIAEDTTPQLGGNLDVNGNLIEDTNGNELLDFSATASAVNYLKLLNSATGDAVELQAQGDDSDVDLVLTPKGSGKVGIGTTSPAAKLDIHADSSNFAWNTPFFKVSIDDTPLIQANSDTNRVVLGAESEANEVMIANPGVGNSSIINFKKSNDKARIEVTEYEGDATEYSFIMEDNPESGGDAEDFFNWKMLSWKEDAYDWKPLQLEGRYIYFAAEQTDYYGGMKFDNTPYYVNDGVVNNSDLTYEDTVSGTLDMSADVSGYTASDFNAYVIKIDGDGSPNTFSWGKNDRPDRFPGNTAWEATGVSITGGLQTLDNGVQINFDATTGGSIGDIWTFGAYASKDVNFTNNGMVIKPSGNVGIGTDTPNQKLTIEGTMDLKEQSGAGSDTAAYGQIWVKDSTPNELYFTDDAGTDTQISSHPLDAPTELYVNGPGLDWIGKRVQNYAGEIYWQTIDGSLTIETFDEYNARRQGIKGHVDLIVRDWDEVHRNQLIAKYMTEEIEISEAEAFEGEELKEGVRLDTETGKLYRKRTEAEAEAMFKPEDIPLMPQWIKDRIG